MMNGTKKSDSSIVPAKPANKAERSAAELVEGDDGTKRNVELQSTVRTQSREAVTQAQARIRGAVTRNEKKKLTALLHHVSIDVLRWAFFNIKKQAAPGVDGLTWVDYAADLDRNLTDLHAGAKGGGRGECESAKHGPGTVPGNRVTGAEAHTARCEDIAKCRLNTRGGSRMPELGPYGSVRGARGNSRPYRESGWLPSKRRELPTADTGCRPNFKSAKTLDLQIPAEVLALADAVIE